MSWDWFEIAAYIVGAFFLIPGIIELAMWRRFVERFVAWGYPAYWPLVTYSLKIVGGLLIFYPPTRIVGLIICLCISVAAIATIVIKRVQSEYKAIPVNLIAIVLAAIAFRA